MLHYTMSHPGMQVRQINTILDTSGASDVKTTCRKSCPANLESVIFDL